MPLRIRTPLALLLTILTACGIGIDPFPNLPAPSSGASFGFQRLKSFSAGMEGETPGGLRLVSDGNLYGVTSEGGPLNGGTLFRIRPDGGHFWIEHSFDPLSAPTGPPIEYEGALYGSTMMGGQNGGGTLYSKVPGGGPLILIHHFPYEDGFNSLFNPGGDLLAFGGQLYGVAELGGTSRFGGFFSFNPELNEIGAWNHNGPDQIIGTPVTFSGQVCGLSPNGGATSLGSILCITGTSVAETKLTFDFDGAGFTGTQPYSLLPDGDRLLVTTQSGGMNNTGTILELGANLTLVRVLHHFEPGLQVSVRSRLIKVGNRIFGTTSVGGEYGLGSLFKMNEDGSNFQVLHSFSGPDGAYPAGNLVFHAGAIYGSTEAGGITDSGTIYSWRLY